MLLSVQQKYILETLRKLGCVRQDQLHALVRNKFQSLGLEIREVHMAAMLRQLRAGQMVTYRIQLLQTSASV